MTHLRTVEGEWASWPVLAALPPARVPSTGRVVVVSAHPDDEVLGAGGLISSWAETEVSLTFLTVTDGAASHGAAPVMGTGTLAARRAAELGSALSALGHRAPAIVALGLPDSAVARHARDLAAGVAECVRGADLVLCPYVADGHPDHDTVAEVTAAVCAGRVPVWQFPIWAWHWKTPADNGVTWDRARRYDLSPEQQRRKRAALACFVTQVRPLPGDESAGAVLPPEVLAHFERAFEVFVT